jgi:hypothetical protein
LRPGCGLARGAPDCAVWDIRQGALEQTTDTARALTGRKPRSFAGFARDHATLFGS